MFGGWDIFEENTLRRRHGRPACSSRRCSSKIRSSSKPSSRWPAVFDQRYVKRLDGPNVKKGKNKKDLAEQLIADIRKFKADHNLDRLVMVWCGSTEVFLKEAPVHQSIAAFEQGLEASDDAIPSSMVYAYAAIREGIPYANAAPNLSGDIPALVELAAQTKSPIAGKDLKTGQTLIKTIIAPGLKARLLGVDGWYSTNILGNRDGEVLDDPESFKTKEESKKSVLDYILQPHLYPELYSDLHHVVRINYYPPRGDNKEGWDNIDLVGWLGYPMQLKINFLCRDSILAAPIVLDVALFLDLAKRAGMSRHPGVAVVLLQEPDARARALSGARPVHPADEAEEHAALHARRGAHHAPRARVLRLRRASCRTGRPRTSAAGISAAGSRPALHRRPERLGLCRRLPIVGDRASLLLPRGCRSRRAVGAARHQHANCCCIWIITGGVLAAGCCSRAIAAPITAGDGAWSGSWLACSAPIIATLVAIQHPAITGSMQHAMLTQPGARRDLPPETASVSRADDARRRGPIALASASCSCSSSQRVRTLGGCSARCCSEEAPPVPPRHRPSPPAAASIGAVTGRDCTDQAADRESGPMSRQSAPAPPKSTRCSTRRVTSSRPPSSRQRTCATRPSTQGPHAIPRRSGRRFASELEWIEPWTPVLDWKPPHAKWFVGGKLNASVNCLDRHVRGRAPQQGRAHLGRRARRPPHADLLRSVPPGLPVRQRAEVARRREGRPRRDLPAAHPGAGDRDAGLRAHRRGPHRRLRRLQRRVAARPHQRRAGQGARHRRRRLPARPDRPAEADGRRGARPATPSIEHVVVVQRSGTVRSPLHIRRAATTGTTS